MLLIVELSGLQVKLKAKESPFAIGHDEIPAETQGIRDELDDVCRYGNTRVAQREEHIDARTNSTKNQANNPGADGVGRDVDIVVSDNSPHLGVGAVVLHERVLNLDALFGISSCDSGVDIGEVVDGQVRVELVGFLKLLEVLETIAARGGDGSGLEGAWDGDNVLGLVALAEEGRRHGGWFI